MSKIYLEKLQAVLEASAKNGIYFEGALFELEPETTLKLLQDRNLMMDTLKRVVAKLHPNSAQSLMIRNCIEQCEAGWPSDPAA